MNQDQKWLDLLADPKHHSVSEDSLAAEVTLTKAAFLKQIAEADFQISAQKYEQILAAAEKQKLIKQENIFRLLLAKSYLMLSRPVSVATSAFAVCLLFFGNAYQYVITDGKEIETTRSGGTTSVIHSSRTPLEVYKVIESNLIDKNIAFSTIFYSNSKIEIIFHSNAETKKILDAQKIETKNQGLISIIFIKK